VSKPSVEAKRHLQVSSRQVLIVDPIHESATKELSRMFNVSTKLQPPEHQLVDLISNVDVIILRSGVQLTAPIIAAAKNLEVIARAGVGIDNIDIAAARQQGITVFNVPAASANSVAEFAMGLILAVTRHIPLADAELRDGRWGKTAHVGMELRGCTLGLIGYGSIGSCVATLAAAFGMNILACVARPDERRRTELGSQGIQLVNLESLLKTSDVVCIAVPLNDRTHHLIASEQLEQMHPGAYLVNLSRGQVVNEDDLYEALRRRKIAGAALDVTVGEGKKTPLVSLKNVVLTPHIAAMTTGAQERIGQILVHSIVASLDGEPVDNQVC
jgi:D-3-phosphoglycerate dehydrogenase